MDPNMIQQLMADPEMAQLMQRPDLMQRMMSVSQDPSQIGELMNDPELAPLMTRMMSMAGGQNGGGMPPAGGNYGSSAPAVSAVREVSSMVQFNNVISEASAAGLPAVVDFTASWCGPCQRIAPRYAELAASYRDKAVFIKVDGDRCRDISEKHRVTGFPTFCFYDRGELQAADTFSGADADRLSRTIAALSEAAEVRRENSKKMKFRHFPIREEERVLFRAVAWDRVLDKVTSLCDTNPELAGKMEVSLFLKSVQELSSFLGDPAMSMSSLEQAHIDALDTLIDWPAEHYSSVLHILRLAAVHPDAAKHLANGLRSPTGSPQPTESATALGRVLAKAESAETATVAVLALRFLANCSGKSLLEKHLVKHMDMALPAASALMLAHHEDKHVLGSGYAFLLDAALALTLHAGQGFDQKASALLASTCDVTSLIVEVCPAAVAAPSVYKALIVAGTVLSHAVNTTSCGTSAVRAAVADTGLAAAAAEWAGVAATDDARAAAQEVAAAVEGLNACK